MVKRIFGYLLLAAIFFSAQVVKAEDAMVIESGKTVTLHYTLTVDGKVVESTNEGGPFEYVHGQRALLSGFEKQLDGLKAGDKRQIVVQSDEAYGPVDPAAVIKIGRDRFPEGNMEEGMVFSTQSQDGRVLRGIVVEMADDGVTMDFNHPLAGKDLLFDIEVLTVI